MSKYAIEKSDHSIAKFDKNGRLVSQEIIIDENTTIKVKGRKVILKTANKEEAKYWEEAILYFTNELPDKPLLQLVQYMEIIKRGSRDPELQEALDALPPHKQAALLTSIAVNEGQPPAAVAASPDMERERLNAERTRIFAAQRELENQLEAVMRGFDALENGETGKAPATRRRSSSGRAGRRNAVLAAIQSAPEGLTRGELLNQLGWKGDKSGEMAASNALTDLTKANTVHRHEGRYRAAAMNGAAP